MQSYKKILQPVGIALTALFLGFSFLFIASPDDARGAFGDAVLKFQTITFKVAFFSIGLLIWFSFLDFKKTFDEAHLSVPHSNRAIAAALCIVAWSLIVFSL